MARLYVPKQDLPVIDPTHRPDLQTKLERTVELLRWAILWLGLLDEPVRRVADAAYGKTEFLKLAQATGMTVVSRLGEESALHTVPEPRLYGEHRINTARRKRPAT